MKQSCEYLHTNNNQSDNTSNDVVAETNNLISKVKILEEIFKDNNIDIDKNVGQIACLEKALKEEKERNIMKEKVLIPTRMLLRREREKMLDTKEKKTHTKEALINEKKTERKKKVKEAKVNAN